MKDSTTVETKFVSITAANLIFSKIFGTSSGFIIGTDKNNQDQFHMLVDENLIPFGNIVKHQKSLPSKVSVKNTNTGIKLSGKLDDIEKIVRLTYSKSRK